MRGLAETRAANDEAARRELAELRADTVKGLRHALATGGVDSVTELLTEAEALTPIFDRFTDRQRQS